MNINPLIQVKKISKEFPIYHSQPFRMIGVVQDITELRNAEEALLESEEHYRELADSISDS